MRASRDSPMRAQAMGLNIAWVQWWGFVISAGFAGLAGALFAFSKDEGLSEHTAPFDAVVFIVDGKADIIIDGKSNMLEAGETIIMPADIRHALKAVEKFKMVQEKFKLDVGDCLFFTDTVGDLAEAGKANIKTVGVSWGVHHKAFFHKADYGNLLDVIDNPGQIVDTVKTYFKHEA